jgi:hypothetical protein
MQHFRHSLRSRGALITPFIQHTFDEWVGRCPGATQSACQYCSVSQGLAVLGAASLNAAFSL